VAIGGAQNLAAALTATVVGGADNVAEGQNAMVAGGVANYANGAASSCLGGSSVSVTTDNKTQTGYLSAKVLEITGP
jgi:hypothetical protein